MDFWYFWLEILRYRWRRVLLLLDNRFMQPATGRLHLSHRVVLMLTRLRIIQRMVGQTHEDEVILHEVGRVLIEVGDLALLFSQIAGKLKTQSAPPGAPQHDVCLNIGGSFLSLHGSHSGKCIKQAASAGTRHAAGLGLVVELLPKLHLLHPQAQVPGAGTTTRAVQPRASDRASC